MPSNFQLSYLNQSVSGRINRTKCIDSYKWTMSRTGTEPTDSASRKLNCIDR